MVGISYKNGMIIRVLTPTHPISLPAPCSNDKLQCSDSHQGCGWLSFELDNFRLFSPLVLWMTYCAPSFLEPLQSD